MTCLQAHIQKVNPKWFWFWRLTEIHSGHMVLTISPLCLFLFFFFFFLSSLLSFFLFFLLWKHLMDWVKNWQGTSSDLLCWLCFGTLNCFLYDCIEYGFNINGHSWQNLWLVLEGYDYLDDTYPVRGPCLLLTFICSVILSGRGRSQETKFASHSICANVNMCLWTMLDIESYCTILQPAQVDSFLSAPVMWQQPQTAPCALASWMLV